MALLLQRAFGPGPAGGGGHLALKQDILYEECPLQLQIILEVVGAGWLVANCLPVELIEDILELAAGCPAAPSGPHHLLSQLLLQQLLHFAELSLPPSQQLVGFCCLLPLVQLLRPLRVAAACCRPPARTIPCHG